MVRSVHSRYVIGFACAALILAGIGAGTILAAARFNADSALVSHTYDVIGRIGQVRTRLFDAISAERNHVLTGDDAYRAQYATARPGLDREIDALSARFADNLPQRERAARLGALVAGRLDVVDRNLALYQQQGFDAAREDLLRGSGRELTERIQKLAREMESVERALLAQRADASRRSAWLLRCMGALGIPLGLAILGWIYVLLVREARERQAAMRASADANLRLTDSVHDLERLGSDLHTLARCGNLLQSSRNVAEALEVVRHTLAKLLPRVAGTVYLIRESQTHAEAEASWGEPPAPGDPVLQPQDCWALRRGQTHLVEDLALGLACGHVHAAAPRAQGAAAVSTACLPLTAHGVPLGLLYLSAPAGALLPSVDIVRATAEQLSLTLGNLRLQETLRHQSIRDPLTGLYNRRYLEESLPRELARCERRDLPLSLLMLDLDHFKALNDRHGHDGGDAALAAFGRLVQASCREEDIACRYGGEEFTVILPETGLDAALRRAEQVRAAVAGMSVRHLQRELGPLTVSIGVAVYPLHATSPPLLKRLADEALYRAKHAGRDRVEAAATE